MRVYFKIKHVLFVCTLLLFQPLENAMSDTSKPNRLAREKSPYLLQHAHNPVDWFPWGPEAFEKARKENKPIFLSIGYSTCHWCHVMEEESFTLPAIAELLNQYFVSIKVDREERPDIDQVYMQAVQSMSGSGGWPMSVFLTNDLKPFYGGTYFPPEDRWGRPGFSTVLKSLHEKWIKDQSSIQQAGTELTEHLTAHAGRAEPSSQSLGLETLQSAYAQLDGTFDVRYGGFGRAPKFPRSHDLSLLLRYWKRAGEKKALGMVETTLVEMARGGIYDHLGGGFHRYSTDHKWHVPHFEKMLYDQALLAKAYLEAYQATGKKTYAQTARGILDYVKRNLCDEHGGFYSAEDADSVAVRFNKTADNAVPPSGRGSDAVSINKTADNAVPPSGRGSDAVSINKTADNAVPPSGRGSDAVSINKTADNAVPPSGRGSAEGAKPKKIEGAFYVWSAEELQAVLGEELAAIVGDYYGVKPGGNAENDPHGEFTGKNILYEARSLEELAEKYGKTHAELLVQLESARKRLFDVREARPKPHLDDKVLTDWNGLMISAFALGSRVLNEPAYLQTARRAADFIAAKLRDPHGRLLHRWREGDAAIPAFIDDYAFLIQGLCDLYEAGFEARDLQAANDLLHQAILLFWDEGRGGFFFSARGTEKLLYDSKELYDGAIPSGNSVMTLNLIRMGRMTMNRDLDRKAEQTLGYFSGMIQRHPSGFTQMLAALDFVVGPSREVVLAGSVKDMKPLTDALDKRFVPNKVVLVNDKSRSDNALLKSLSPFTADQTALGGRPTAYVCKNHVCALPVYDPIRFGELLDKP